MNNRLSSYYQPLELTAWQLRKPHIETAKKLVIVCEAPDTHEDALLTAMLCAIGYTRDEVQLVNSQQVDNLQPGLLLAFGQTAAQELLKNQSSLESLRGQIHYIGKDQTPVIVTYGPADLLNTPSLKKNAYSDLKLASRTLATPL